MVSVFGVKARAFDQIETTTYDIAGSESWTVNLKEVWHFSFKKVCNFFKLFYLSGTTATKCVAIIAMVPIRHLIPTRQSVSTDLLHR